ncbi:hypothetical protein AAF712_007743 [Marasmius tenuissimus]|uniref:Fungal-type protein kinase domain-containing protein n=1 Tax=Marasmius tenuissimus TaxID=585030 RepID=A0ABR2ZY64_9AGAR
MADASNTTDPPQTPPKNRPNTDIKVLRQTPRKVDSTFRRNYKLSAAEFRKVILQTMGRTLPELKVPVFLNGPLPEVSNTVVDETWNVLKTMVWKDGEALLDTSGIDMTKATRVVGKGGRWGWYENANPIDMGNEDVVYKHIQDICDCIVKAAEVTLPGKKPAARFRCRPTKTALSDTQNSEYRTDADMELVDGSDSKNDRSNLWDSVVNAEFKKSDTELDKVNQNIQQVVGNAAHMLYSDPRRRFRFGLTIENCDTRLWFFSRAVSYVSEGFNFIEDPKPFIQFILALSFASKEEMGYDLTVKRVEFEGEWVYDYQALNQKGETTWYRTKSLIYNHQSMRILGRAIRVWEVYVLDAHGNPIEEEFNGQRRRRVAVLKDCWLTVDAHSESKTQKLILEAYRQARGLKEGDDPAKYFMTILCDIIVMAGGVEDTTHAHFRNGIPPTDRVYELVRKTPHRVSKPSISSGVNSRISRGTGGGFDRIEEEEGSIPKFDRPDNGLTRIYESRKHSRTVFDEVGVRLDDIKDQQVLVDCLVDALGGLEVLYYAGWVHRDVSVGNLLRCHNGADGTYVCKITDLEYARPFQEEVGLPHDHKTGTPAYMAIEVQKNGYCFQASEESNTSLPQARPIRGPDGKRIVRTAPLARQQNAKVEIPFFHNYLHDVEALWWIMMWNVFSTVPAEMEHTMSGDQYEKYTSHALELFPSTLDGNTSRADLIRHQPDYERHQARLCDEYQNLASMMVQLLEILREFYVKVERPLENVLKHAAYAEVYEDMILAFQAARPYALPHVKYLDQMKKAFHNGGTSATVSQGSAVKRPHSPELTGDEPPAKLLNSRGIAPLRLGSSKKRGN